MAAGQDGSFKGRHFTSEVILWALRWYLAFPISYRDLASMLSDRGVAVDHTTLFRWVQAYAAKLEQRVRRHLRLCTGSWRVDETYMEVNGAWTYLYRAVDSFGQTIDFLLSARRNAAAAKRFFRKALAHPHTVNPRTITVDKNPAYPRAAADMRRADELWRFSRLRQGKYLNNIVEQDHRRIKRLVRPGLGFGSLRTARRTLAGYEVMAMIRKGQAHNIGGRDMPAQTAFIAELFEVAAGPRLLRRAPAFATEPRRASTGSPTKVGSLSAKLVQRAVKLAARARFAYHVYIFTRMKIVLHPSERVRSSKPTPIGRQGDSLMRTQFPLKGRLIPSLLAVAASAATLITNPVPSFAQSAAPALSPKLSLTNIGGLVTSVKGPEPGVWVIAETTDLPTRYIKIVVTDEQGRYLIPDLPSANYNIWVRGYGLVDSPKMHGVPGQALDLGAVIAPTEAEAAHYDPAIYWYSMLKIPDDSQFGGKGDIPAEVTRPEWLTSMKNRNCVGCHQQGQEATRTFPSAFSHFPSSTEAWMRRVQSGQSGLLMVNPLAGELGGAPFQYFAAYTDAIAQGALPSAKPPRPQGIERNVVLTMWGWGSDHTYLHDPISTDKRHPTVNANGPVWGSPEYSSDALPILDPTGNTASFYQTPRGDPNMPESLGPGHAAMEDPLNASAYWGDQKIWSNHFNNHNAMFDGQGRLWFTGAGRGPDNPAFCKQGSDLVSARLFPLDQSRRQLAMYDPKTKKFTYIDTCFETQHLQFGFDADDTLWTSGGGPVIGWLNTRKYLATGDAKASQGWVALASGTKDKGVTGSGSYAIMPSPVDASVWATVNVGAGAGGIVRLDPGANPPESARVEFFKVPAPGFAPRGGDIDSQGVVWVSLGSGHLGRFNRRKCNGPLDNGPGPSGVLCAEGWSFNQYPGPGFAGIGANSAEASYTPST